MNTITNEYLSTECTPLIDNEMRDLLPPLSGEARGALENDILENGCYSPMICMEDMTLVDGHNRFAICEEYNIPYRVITLPFTDKLAAKQWALDTQKARRNLSTWELGQISLKLKPEIEARAKKRQGMRTDILATLPECSEPMEKGTTRKELADAAGIGERTMGKIMKIEKNAPESVKAAVEDNEISVSKGYSITQQLRYMPEDEREAAAIALLEQAYQRETAEAERTNGIARQFNKALEATTALEVTEENVWHWIEWSSLRRSDIEMLVYDIGRSIDKLTQLQELLMKIYAEEWKNPYDRKSAEEEAIAAAYTARQAFS